MSYCKLQIVTFDFWQIISEAKIRASVLFLAEK